MGDHLSRPRGEGEPLSELTWRSFARHLEGQLANLPADEYLILEAGMHSSFPGAFVQFKSRGDSLLCEAVSDVYLAEHFQLGEQRNQKLRRLGWSEPGLEGNWALALTDEERFRKAARLAIASLRGVYDVESPADVTYTASTPAVRLGIDPTSPASSCIALRRSEVEDILGQDLRWTLYGTSPDGVHSIGVGDDYLRIRLNRVGPVSILQAALDFGPDHVPSSNDPSFRSSQAHRSPGGISMVIVEDGEDRRWLVSSRAIDQASELEAEAASLIRGLIVGAAQIRSGGRACDSENDDVRA